MKFVSFSHDFNLKKKQTILLLTFLFFFFFFKFLIAFSNIRNIYAKGMIGEEILSYWLKIKAYIHFSKGKKKWEEKEISGVFPILVWEIEDLSVIHSPMRNIEQIVLQIHRIVLWSLKYFYLSRKWYSLGRRISFIALL